MVAYAAGCGAQFDENNPDPNGWQLYVHYLLSFGPGIIFSFIEALTMSYDFLASAIQLAKVAKARCPIGCAGSPLPCSPTHTPRPHPHHRVAR